MKLSPLPLLVVAGLLLLSSCRPDHPTITTGGPEVVSFRALPFELGDVQLLPGPFLSATELNAGVLLNYDPDRFLATFRMDAGLEPKAERYGGWEGMSLAGHSLGHYLSACALMYQTTGDEEFLRRVNYIVDELALCQQAHGDGYIGAFTRVSIDDVDITTPQDEYTLSGKYVFEEEIAKGIIVSAPFSLNGIWAPYYTQHKVMAGLRDAYLLCGNKKALEVKTAFADWLYGVLAHLPHETIQEMLVCEYGGINEVLAELYGFTGDDRHLELSRIFHDEEVLGPLTMREDRLQGKHANTQIPKVTGLARRYELTGDMTDRKSAEFFWRTVIDNHTYVTGGNCNEEYFGEPGKLRDRLGPNTTETCNVYNMLRLTKHLFQWEADAELADYYERALLNHIRASQHPIDGRVIYNLNIDMGGRKTFQDPFGFTCCVGTGMENHSKYGAAIYFHNHDELFVNLFIASQLHWKEKNLVVRQETAFPKEEGSLLVFTCQEPVDLTLQVRYPHWAAGEMEISVNGEPHPINQQPGSFVGIKRTWKSGDEVQIHFPFSLRLEHMPDDKDRVAIFYGPVLLAGNLGPEDDPAIADPDYVPVLMTTSRDPANWTEPLDGLHHFATRVGRPRDVPLQPFYSIYNRRYTIFWDMMTESGWEKRLNQRQQQKERLAALDRKTFDKVTPADRELEEQKNFRGEGTHVRFYKQRSGREANRGGWFSYALNIPPDEKTTLVVAYWGGFEGSRTFDILADDLIIATENISGKKDGHFIRVAYPVPQDITHNKETITVSFVPHDFHRAGPVFGLRTVQKTDLDKLELN